MKNAYGRNISLSVFGTSHGDAVGLHLEGFPKGVKIDRTALLSFLLRRAPGGSNLTTSRKEKDIPDFLEGVDENGVTTGGTITALIRNENQHSADYAAFYDTPRPGHADFPALIKYGKTVDLRGGGIFSGRLTAPLAVAGGLALQYLSARGIEVGAHIQQVGTVEDTPFPLHPSTELFNRLKNMKLPFFNEEKVAEAEAEILRVKEEGDSLGGSIECAVTGLPVGLGEHMFEGVEGRVSSLLYAIPAVKGVEFGKGFALAAMKGSEANDAFRTDGTSVFTETNACGGILGGMTDGMPLVFRVCIKPTPSIGKVQNTVSLSRMENTTLAIKGRHDPSILPRAVPVVEAAAAIAVLDLLLDPPPHPQEMELSDFRREIDGIDRDLLRLFEERMALVRGVADCKARHRLPILDEKREAALLEEIQRLAKEENAPFATALYEKILLLSKEAQQQHLAEKEGDHET